MARSATTCLYWETNRQRKLAKKASIQLQFQRNGKTEPTPCRENARCTPHGTSHEGQDGDDAGLKAQRRTDEALPRLRTAYGNAYIEIKNKGGGVRWAPLLLPLVAVETPHVVLPRRRGRAVEDDRPGSLLTLVRLHEQRGVPHYSHEVWLSMLACVQLRARVRSLRAWRRRRGAEASRRCKPRAAVRV